MIGMSHAVIIYSLFFWLQDTHKISRRLELSLSTFVSLSPTLEICRRIGIIFFMHISGVFLIIVVKKDDNVVGDADDHL